MRVLAYVHIQIAASYLVDDSMYVMYAHDLNFHVQNTGLGVYITEIYSKVVWWAYTCLLFYSCLYNKNKLFCLKLKLFVCIMALFCLIVYPVKKYLNFMSLA